MPVFNNALAGAAGSGGDAGYKIERSLRFNDDDSSHLNRTPSSAGNRKTWTWSAWVKRSELGRRQYLFTSGLTTGSGESSYMRIAFENTDKLWIGSWNYNFRYPEMLFRDTSAWYHIVLKFDSTASTEADRCIIYVNGVEQSTTGDPNIQQNADYAVNSTELHHIGLGNSSANYFSGYLADVNLIDGQALDPTYFGEFDADTGVWNPIKYSGTYGTNGFHLDFSDNSSNAALGTDSSGNSNTWTVNNLQVSGISYGTTSNSSQSAANTYLVSDHRWSANANFPGHQAFNGNTNITGSIGQVVFHAEGGYSKPVVSNAAGGVEAMGNGGGITMAINGGTQVAVGNGSWTKISGTFDGTLDSLNVYDNINGFSYFKGIRINGVEIAVRLKTDNPENIDSLIDTPTNYEADSGNNGGNYATWNRLLISTQNNLSNGNLDLAHAASQGWTGNNQGSYHQMVVGTIGMTTGKWYWEITLGTMTDACIGLMGSANGHNYYVGYSANGKTEGWGWASNGINYNTNGLTVAGSPAAFAAGDTLGFAYDADNGYLYCHKNGTYQNSGDPAAGTGYQVSGYTGTQYFAASKLGSNSQVNLVLNAGQRPFAYTPPTGFKSVCTQNLDDPLIADGSTAFDTVLYTGDGQTTQTVSLPFDPGFLWQKKRSGVSSHYLFDAIRGFSNSKALGSHTSDAEGVNSAYYSLSVSGSNLTLGDVGAGNEWNVNNQTHVIWTWDGGDLATNSAYDQSQVWSNFWSATNNGIEAANPATQAHDGILTGLGMRLNASSSCTWAPTGGYSYTGNFLIYCCKDNDYTGVSWTCVHAGGTTDFTSSVAAGTTQTAVNLTSLGVQSPITSISFTSNNNSNPRVSGMSANGKILIDAGVIPVGSLNSSAYDQSQQWSNYLSASGGSGFANNGNGAFSGTRNFIDYTYVNGATSGTNYTMTFTPPSAISFTSSLRVQVEPSHGKVSIDGGTTYVNGGSTGLVTFNGPGSFTSITVADTRNQWSGEFAWVEVDGKLLVNSNATPPNVPSIASTVRANPTAGFSIVTYSQGAAGSVVGHGLNKNPEMIIAKKRNGSDQPWVVYHSALGKGGVLQLHATDAVNTTYSTYWGNSEPDSNVFGLYTASAPWANNSGNMAAYCFAPVEGYSAFGSYTGNGSTDGTFVYTGFRPKWILLKSKDGTSNWAIQDTSRSPYNVQDIHVTANLTNSEYNGTLVHLDTLSNGFKLRTTFSEYNGSGQNFIYAAFAENPFKTARAR